MRIFTSAVAAFVLIAVTMPSACLADKAMRTDGRFVGPDGQGLAYALAAAPSDPRIVYSALKSGGICRSEDGGRSWNHAAGGLPPTLVFRSLAINPDDPNIVFAGTRLPAAMYRTTNGGQSWTQVLNLSSVYDDYSEVATIRYSPANSSIMLAGLLGYYYSTYYPSPMYRSTNGGQSWNRVTPNSSLYGYGGVSSVWFDPAIGGRVLAGFCGSYDNKDGMVVSYDNGATWQGVASGPFSGSAAPSVLDIAHSPSNRQRMYAACVGSSTTPGVYKSDDWGLTWTPAGGGLPSNASVGCLCTDPLQDDTVYAVMGSPDLCNDYTYFSSPAYLFRTKDGGGTWEPCVNGLPTPGYDWVYTMLFYAMLPSDSYTHPTLLVGSPSRGLFRLERSSSVFTPSYTGMKLSNCRSVSVCPTLRRMLVGLSSDVSPVRSGAVSVGNVAWSVNAPTLSSASSATYLMRCASQPDTVVGLIASNVRRSSDGGGQWQPPTFYGSCLGGNLSPGATIYTGGYGTLSGSTDMGQTWAGLGGFVIPGVSVYSVCDGPSTSRIVAGARNTGSTAQGFYLSNDGGQAFEKRNNGLPIRMNMGFAAYNPADANEAWLLGPYGVCHTANGGTSWSMTSSSYIDPYGFAVLPTTPRRLLYCSYYELYMSQNNGASWSQIALPEGSGSSLRRIKVAPSDPARVYMLGYQHLYRSDNSASTWVRTSLPISSPRDIAINPTNPQHILVCDYYSIHSSTNGGATWTQLTRPASSSYHYSLAMGSAQNLYAGDYQRVYRSVNGGASWSTVNLPSGSDEILQLCAHPMDPSVIYGMDYYCRVYRSGNYGGSWFRGPTPYNEYPSAYSIEPMAISPANVNTAILAWPYRAIFRSTNGAASWTELRDGLESCEVTAVATHPTDPAILFAGTEQDGLYRSAFHANNWAPVLQASSIRKIWCNPSQPNQVLAATGQGLYYSTNTGSNWSLFTPDLQNVPVNDFSVVESAEGFEVTAATEGRGIWTTLVTRQPSLASDPRDWPLYE